MGSRVRTREIFEGLLEAGVVSIKPGEDALHFLLGERKVDSCREGGKGLRAREVTSTENIGEVTADVVGDGVGKLDVLQTTSGDLVIVGRVAPTTEALGSIIGKDSSVEEVSSIYVGVRTAFQQS